MKKIVALTLILSIFLAFAACSNTENAGNKNTVQKTDIIGEWIAVNANAAITLNEDGTGELEFNGTQSVTWSFNADTQKFTVVGAESYEVIVGKEYDMPYLNMLDMSFYHFDDYDKAYTLLISRRCEDIVEHTIDMTKIELNKAYDLANGMTIQFTGFEVNKNSSPKSIQMHYSVTNDRNETVENVSVVMRGRYYLADYPLVLEEEKDCPIIHTIGKYEMAYGTISFSLKEDPVDTLKLYGRVIGVACIEMYGSQYYIDLGDWFKM